MTGRGLAVLFSLQRADRLGNGAARRLQAIADVYVGLGLDILQVVLSSPHDALAKDAMPASWLRPRIGLTLETVEAAARYLSRDPSLEMDFTALLGGRTPALVHVSDWRLHALTGLIDVALSQQGRSPTLFVLDRAEHQPMRYSEFVDWLRIGRRSHPNADVVLEDGARDLAPETDQAVSEAALHFCPSASVLMETTGLVFHEANLDWLRDGLFWFPPEKRFAVTGPGCDTMFRSQHYQRQLHSNSDRIQFFPDPSPDLRDALLRSCRVVVAPPFTATEDPTDWDLATPLALNKSVVGPSASLGSAYGSLRTTRAIGHDDPATFGRAVNMALQASYMHSARDRRTRSDLSWEGRLSKSGLRSALKNRLSTQAQ